MLDVDELNRRIEANIARKSSLIGHAAGVSMNRSLELVGARLKAAMGKPDSTGKQEPSAEQSKTSDQTDSEGFESMWEEYTERIACLRDSSAETITPEKLKAKLDALLILGLGLLMALEVKQPQAKAKLPKKTIEDFSRIDVNNEYQFWYTEALAVIKRVLPSRSNEFVGFYKYPRKRSKLTGLNLRISDAICEQSVVENISYGITKSTFTNTRVLALPDCFSLVKAQCEILNSARESFTSSLHKIQQVAQAELLDSELSAARRLNKNGSTCAAGAIAGVVLEKHLNAVIGSHGFKMLKKSPGINDYARKLKGKGVIDFQTCWFIQSLGNLCDLCYNAKSEPTKEEVEELISGVAEIVKTMI